MVGDLPIKKDVMVAVGWIEINFNEKYFGKDVFEYRPERWLNGEVKLDSSYIFTPFSMGPRGCIGQKFARI